MFKSYLHHFLEENLSEKVLYRLFNLIKKIQDKNIISFSNYRFRLFAQIYKQTLKFDGKLSIFYPLAFNLLIQFGSIEEAYHALTLISKKS